MTEFTVVYSNTTKQKITAYSAEFKPGFVLFYDGHTTTALNASAVLEISWRAA